MKASRPEESPSKAAQILVFPGTVVKTKILAGEVLLEHLNLDDEGNCYVAAKPGCYLPGDFDREVAKLEECLEALQTTLETSYDESFIARKREGLRQEGISLLTFQVEPKDEVIH